jgi:hypothetical protein
MKKIGMILAGFVANPIYFDCNPACPAATAPPTFNATAGGYLFNIVLPSQFDFMPYVLLISSLAILAMYSIVYLRKKRRNINAMLGEIDNLIDEESEY